MPTNTLIDFRESVEASVDTWEILDDRGDETGFDFRVPGGVSSISRIRCGAGLDIGTTGGGAFRLLNAFKIAGEGLRETGPYYFLGQYGNDSGTTNAEEGIIAEPASYLCNIPVNPGQEFQAQGKMIGEDAGAINPFFEVTYDPVLPSGITRKFDVREADRDTATTDSLSAVNVDLEGSSKDFVVPAGASTIVGIATASALDYDSENPMISTFKLSGDGVGLTDPINWVGQCGGYNVAGTSAASTHSYQPVKVVPMSIPVNPSFQIAAEVKTIADDSGPGTFAVGLLYA